jgi:hypothetical protein
MIKRCLLFCIISFSILITHPGRSEYIFGPDEYSVYEAVVNDWLIKLGDRGLIVRDRTALVISIDDLEKELVFVKSNFAGCLPETISDFKAKSISSYPVESFLSQLDGYTLISHDKIVELFSYKDGWGRFYQNYPDAAGILTFSRVGFNRYKSQALVCVSSQWGDFSGAGAYLLLDKNNLGIWSITQSVRVWHSWIPEENETLITPGHERQIVF